MKSLKAIVGIAAIIGLICLVLVTLIITIRPEHLPVAPWIVLPLCLMGTAMGYLSAKVRVNDALES
ncbi:MAG: hypothetical protein SynsKO_34580 [Synoicihabitans sp.]